MSPLLVSIRLLLSNLTKRAAWLRKRALLGLAIVGTLAVGVGWALCHNSAERNLLVRIMPFFFAFAVLVIQVQYIALLALRAWLMGQSRRALFRLAGVVLLFGGAYILIIYIADTFSVANH
jgi:hypothetical protein